MQTLEYRTRDAKGNDLVKLVPIKEFPLHDFDPPQACAVCGKVVSSGCLLGECVSSDFCDWSWFDTDCICLSCSRYFTLYKFSYIINGDYIHLYNVREMAQQLKQPQKPPFMAVITTNQKKHYFYKAKMNQNISPEYIQFDDESICTTPDHMMLLFSWVEAAMSLGSYKDEIAHGELPAQMLLKTGASPLKWLRKELNSDRQIQIPLYLAQRIQIPEDTAVAELANIQDKYNAEL